MVTDELRRLQPACDPPPDLNADYTSAERAEVYGRVKALFITTRILVVDLLTERLAPKHIAGQAPGCASGRERAVDTQ